MTNKARGTRIRMKIPAYRYCWRSHLKVMSVCLAGLLVVGCFESNGKPLVTEPDTIENLPKRIGLVLEDIRQQYSGFELGRSFQYAFEVEQSADRRYVYRGIKRDGTVEEPSVVTLRRVAASRYAAQLQAINTDLYYFPLTIGKGTLTLSNVGVDGFKSDEELRSILGVYRPYDELDDEERGKLRTIDSLDELDTLISYVTAPGNETLLHQRRYRIFDLGEEAGRAAYEERRTEVLKQVARCDALGEELDIASKAGELDENDPEIWKRLSACFRPEFLETAMKEDEGSPQDEKISERQQERTDAAAQARDAAVAARRAGGNRSYIARLRASIERHWKIPPGTKPEALCVATATQALDGEVLDVQMKSCTDASTTFIVAVEKSIYAASPLPMPEDMSLFERQFQLTFRGTSD